MDKGLILIVKLTGDADILIVFKNSRVEVDTCELLAYIFYQDTPVEVIFDSHELYALHELDIVTESDCLEEQLI